MPFVTTKAGGQCFAFPDVCNVPSPGGPVPTPLPNTAECRNADGTVASVLVTNKEVVVESSRIPSSTGDEAGSLGGVVSGVFRGPATFKTASAKVYAKGKRVILHGAQTAQNGDNANMPSGQQVSPSQTKVVAGS
ncbi:Hypothetical protein A7982_03070 [Minicystis rosea]|nr:Hypothetical protein A7982_03070 [Minicystis rosea]